MNAWEESFLDGLRPQEKLTVDQWADKYRKLSSRGAAEPGRATGSWLLAFLAFRVFLAA